MNEVLSCVVALFFVCPAYHGLDDHAEPNRC
jgi:hypothetical protein